MLTYKTLKDKAKDFLGRRLKTNCCSFLSIQKTSPLQTLHGLQFGLSQLQTHYWIHRLLPVLRGALADLKMTPERDGQSVANSDLVNEHAPDLLIDGTERRRQRPKDDTKQTTHYSGKKKAQPPDCSAGVPA